MRREITRIPEPWDYLVLTASSDRQAEAYEAHLGMRREMGHLARARQTLVVADLEGKRIGSGGSTLECLIRIVNRERRDGEDATTTLSRLRILIVHAGGDSRRLPAYGPCGKIFLPVPGESESALPCTLFDRLVPEFLDLPGGVAGSGQILVASGDALVRFDPQAVTGFGAGITLLGAHAAPEEAAHHGVFCVAGDRAVRLYLQKPSLAQQREAGAIGPCGRSTLDIGILSMDAAAASTLLDTFDTRADDAGVLSWQAPMRERLLAHGIDLYREICCAIGSQATLAHFVHAARSSGSQWQATDLARLFPGIQHLPARVQVLAEASFLHFGSTRQLITSGIALAMQDRRVAPGVTSLSLNNSAGAEGRVAGSDAWVEGCRIEAPLKLGGWNVVTGVDVRAPLDLPEGACLDVVPGHARNAETVWFVRCYGIGDTFKDAGFCNRPILDWLAAAGLGAEDVWDASADRTLWNARVFPAESEPNGYRRWLWMFEPGTATAAERETYRNADRYSAAEIASLADLAAFHRRRSILGAAGLRSSWPRLLGVTGTLTAEDLTVALRHAERPAEWVAEILTYAESMAGETGDFTYSRILHSLGTAIGSLTGDASVLLATLLPGLPSALPAPVMEWARSVCLAVENGTTAAAWSARLCELAFHRMNEAILHSSLSAQERPRNALRPDETIWGRGPARIELGGGWTDTPPYTLEHGGDVINTAVNLNGQPPIHCYCRITEEPVIRLNSIDGGARVEIRELEDLLDYRRPEDRFALAKAALAISGFSPEMADWPAGITLRRMLEEFGGGIEITTLVGIPKGSGLGTSSILGAVIVAVLRRLMGRYPTERELFHEVLRLEQALTTGGGWQDQIGGCVGGSKIASTLPGFFPDPHIHYVPDDVIDPRANGGATLLYYTGLTRLAKNILQEIVGGYLNRNRAIMAALAEEHLVAHSIADAMSRKDAAGFGHYLNAAWELQKRLCGTVTNEPIEWLLAKVRPYVHGMRISGAGSGGFLLMICKSPADAARVREILEREPLNERSRFFDFEVNRKGLEVTTC